MMRLADFRQTGKLENPARLEDLAAAFGARPAPRLVLFGAGMGLKGFVRVFSEVAPAVRPALLVDNAAAKWGREIRFDDFAATVQEPAALLALAAELAADGAGGAAEVIVVVTAKDATAILAQLAAMPLPVSWQIVHAHPLAADYRVRRAAHPTLPASFRVTEEERIPRVIHYCWFGGAPLPERYQAWMASWKKFCPDYEIVRWDESNYDITQHPYMRAACAAKKWGFVTDYARLDIIYQHGGIYLDTDVELLRPLDDFLYEDGFAGSQPDGRVATGLGFGARAGLPILRELRDAYDRETFVDFTSRAERFQKEIRVCPDIQMDVLTRHGVRYRGFDFQEAAGLRIYPVPVLCGLVGETVIDAPFVYAIHHFDGSWVPKG